MEFKDWITVVVSLVVGLGASGMTLFVTSRQVTKKSREDKEKALRNYERALTELLTELDHLEGADQAGGLLITEVPSRYRSVWEEAYHHVEDFPAEDRAVLRWPFGPETEAYDAIRRLDQGVKALRRYLGS